jgi:3-hydroxy-9,10-secoandrosta-1,3,5(10)-triene-9,17-dione monooxygenase reductase component
MDITTDGDIASLCRRALGSFASGVGIVSTIDADGAPVGMTATSFTALSFDPASVLVCVRRDSRTRDNIAAARRFAVNLLPAHAEDIALLCAVPGGSKQLPADWLRETPIASPVLREAISVVDCQVTDLLESGTHTIVIGVVTGVGLSSHRRASEPLIHYRGAFRHLEAIHPARSVDSLPLISLDELIREAV